MSEGIKHDQKKVRMDLIPWQAVKEIAKVLTFGAEKYGPYNWQHLDDPQPRLFAALQRHMLAWWDGDDKDDETGISHLAHAGCCILFLLWFELPHRAFARGQSATDPLGEHEQHAQASTLGQPESKVNPEVQEVVSASRFLSGLTHF